MKAIITEEARFSEFLLLLDAKESKIKEEWMEMLSIEVLERHGIKVTKGGLPHENAIPKALVAAVVNQVRREMQYEFCQWAQAQGASLTR